MKTLHLLAILVATSISATGCIGSTASSEQSSDAALACANVPPGEQPVCEQCLARPPLGEPGAQACDSQSSWPSNGLCCATTQPDGSCTATYSSSTSRVQGRCQ